MVGEAESHGRTHRDFSDRAKWRSEKLARRSVLKTLLTRGRVVIDGAPACRFSERARRGPQAFQFDAPFFREQRHLAAQAGAAERLGLKRTTVKNKVRKLGIELLPADTHTKSHTWSDLLF